MIEMPLSATYIWRCGSPRGELGEEVVSPIFSDIVKVTFKGLL